MPEWDQGFPSIRHHIRLEVRRHNFTISTGCNHEPNKNESYFSSVMAQGRPRYELVQISNMSNTLLHFKLNTDVWARQRQSAPKCTLHQLIFNC